MTSDNSWESLFKPGEATDYFCFTDAPPILTGTEAFQLSNAWWLAEISRLIYHPDFYEKNDISFGEFQFGKVAYIKNKETSTHVALLKVIQETPCLVIAFRGTDEIEDWSINARAYQNSFNKGKVHRGFRKAYLSIQKELFAALEGNTLPIFITGHSLGAALAVLATSELFNNSCFDSCYTFGSPRVGDPEFIKSFNTNSIYRIVNNSDIVTTVPIDFATIIYNHVGSAYLLDDKGELHEQVNEDDVYAYQKSRLQGLKDYALSKFFNNELNTIKDDLPSFLADHSPINYTFNIQQLLSHIDNN